MYILCTYFDCFRRKVQELSSESLIQTQVMGTTIFIRLSNYTSINLHLLELITFLRKKMGNSWFCTSFHYFILSADKQLSPADSYKCLLFYCRLRVRVQKKSHLHFSFLYLIFCIFSSHDLQNKLSWGNWNKFFA